jgi:hypothetical protein
MLKKGIFKKDHKNIVFSPMGFLTKKTLTLGTFDTFGTLILFKY